MEQLQAKTVREEREPLDSRVCKAQDFEWRYCVEVADNLKVHLYKPHSAEQARNLIALLNLDEASGYDNVKGMLLREFKWSSSALFDRFIPA